MTFSRKIFISVFASTLVLGTVLMWAAHRYVSQQEEERFISRYSVFAKVLGDTLSRLDRHTESLMKNAASVIEAKDAEQGLLSTDVLKNMRADLSMTHIFVVDKNGKFIRSTNEDPKLIPNAYSFCEDYRDLIAGKSKVEATPIIHPQPEPLPYKFLFIPNRDRSRLIGVGVRVDFIAKTLSEALGSDSNLISMSLFSPHGKSFGRFSSTDVDFHKEEVVLPESFPSVSKGSGAYKFYVKVQSSHPQCCQCEVSKTSKNGEYYYVLESEVSSKALAAAQAATTNIFFGFAIANLLFSFALGRFFSRKLVKNIETAVSKVRKIKSSGSFDERIGLNGSDEVTYLTNEFDNLLDSLKESQEKIIESEKIHVKVQMAKEIAHNIKSPIVAVEMMIPMLVQVPEKIRQVLRDSVREVKFLAERLSRQADSLAIGTGMENLTETVHLPRLIGCVIHEKQIEYTGNKKVDITYKIEGPFDAAYANVDPVELRAVISNVINNAVESYQEGGGLVQITCKILGDKCLLLIRDLGRGIKSEVLDHLGKKSILSDKKNGKGLGLHHAYRVVGSWNGRIHIKTEIGCGTEIEVVLPTGIDIQKQGTGREQRLEL